MSLNAKANPTPGCECVACDTTRRQRRRQRKQLQRGWSARVPALPVADHIDALVDAGWSMARIAVVTQTPSVTVSEIRARRFKRVDRETADAILALHGEPQNVYVSPVGTIRRLQALAVLGWPMREVCTRAGLAPRFGADSMRNRKPTILAESAKAIAAVYDELSMTAAPNGGVNNHVRSFAVRRGWAPPLAYVDIDDPKDLPMMDDKLTRWTSIDERFWGRVDKGEDCWLWTGSLTKKGYGARIKHAGKAYYPHQFSYTINVGPIPDGLVIDHLCRVRNCVNFDHLEPVTALENTRRGAEARWFEACTNGHDPSFRSEQPGGKVRCSECEREGGRRYFEANRERILAARREKYAERRKQEAAKVDPVVVDRILDGDVVPSTNAERREVVRRWMADGRSYRALEALTGWRVERYFEAAA